MEVTVHSIYDKLLRTNIECGLGDRGYETAMHEINVCPYSDSSRYEYFGIDMELDFQWHMTDEQYKFIRDEIKDKGIFGWMAVGNIIVEFRCVGGGYDDVFHFPVDDVYIYGQNDPELGYEIHGVPYLRLERDIDIPKRRTKEGFQRAFEQLVVSFITDNAELLVPEALNHTVTEKEWN